jgi:hypothetical protein
MTRCRVRWLCFWISTQAWSVFWGRCSSPAKPGKRFLGIVIFSYPLVPAFSTSISKYPISTFLANGLFARTACTTIMCPCDQTLFTCVCEREGDARRKVVMMGMNQKGFSPRHLVHDWPFPCTRQSACPCEPASNPLSTFSSEPCVYPYVFSPCVQKGQKREIPTFTRWETFVVLMCVGPTSSSLSSTTQIGASSILNLLDCLCIEWVFVCLDLVWSDKQSLNFHYKKAGSCQITRHSPSTHNSYKQVLPCGIRNCVMVATGLLRVEKVCAFFFHTGKLSEELVSQQLT